MAVCAYLIASQLFLHKMYNIYVAVALHVWLLIFWIVDLGLVANLARMWGDGERCYYTSYYGYTCYYKRDLGKREDTTTYAAYHGALAAGAVFAAVELVTWALSAIITIMAWNKQRTAGTSAQPHAQHSGVVPPQYDNNNGQAVPMEKYNQPSTMQTPQTQYAQPVQQQHQYGAPYAQDPVPRQDTVSPVSHAGTGYGPPPSNVSQLNSPQHTGQHAYPQNATELHTAPYDPHVPELSNHR
ncbi:hypothetical protein N0V90_013260 [Kalmusia sp. IMI 367209]|nr:hypothetical protein N0V90_013260 [Kalmusia sp. IMI 367209]